MKEIKRKISGLHNEAEAQADRSLDEIKRAKWTAAIVLVILVAALAGVFTGIYFLLQ